MMKMVFAVVLLPLFLMCSATTDKQQGSDATVRPDETITIDGTVTDEGVECPALRTEKNELYTIAGGDRDVLRPGVRVRVSGTIAQISFCQQGTTINATTVDVLR